MKNPLEQFMQEGLLRYADAYETIKYFQDQVVAIARDVLDSEDRKYPFKLAETGKAISEFRGSKPQKGIWICIAPEGTYHHGAPGRIELGLWWNPPGIDLPA